MALTKATLIDLNSNELILDLDADTSITADTDDTIHFKIAGSDEITMTATAFAPSTSDGQALGTSSLMFADLFLASGSVVNFNNGDVTLTHSSNTLTLGGGALDVDGGITIDNITIDGTEIDLSSGDLTIDVAGDIVLDADGGDVFVKDAGTTFGSLTNTSGNLIIKSGTTTAATFSGANVTFAGTVGSGAITSSAGLVIADAGNIGSASDTDAIAIGSDGDVTLTQDLELQHDGAILSFGANDEIALTHVHDTGLLLTDSGGSPTLQLHDANESVSSDGSKLILTSNGVAFSLPTADGSSGQALVTNGSGVISFTTLSANTPSSADGQALGSASLEWSDLFLADGGTIQFGNDQEVRLIHTADTGLILKHTATADDKPVSLTLQTGETDMAANDVIGKIDFQAPDEGTGTDAILVAAGIEAVAEGDFSSSNNATKLSFKTAASEAAAEKMSLSSAGVLDVLGGSVVAGGLMKIDVDADADDLTGDSATGRLTIGAGEDLNLYHGGTNSYIVNDTGDLIIDTAGDIILDAAGTDFIFKDGGVQTAHFVGSGDNFLIVTDVSDGDFKILGNDGGSQITPFVIDMSEGGRLLLGSGQDATFGQLGIESTGDATVDLFANVGSGSRGKAEIFFSTDSSSDHVSIASMVAQQPSGDEASRKGEIIFNVSDNGAPAAAMTIQNNKSVHFASGIDINDGDLVFASGHGIDFSATADSSATGATDSSETFKDYEEGDWTPAATALGVATVHTAKYTKIGEFVSVYCDITRNASPADTSQGTSFSGMPFNAGDDYPNGFSFCATVTEAVRTAASGGSISVTGLDGVALTRSQLAGNRCQHYVTFLTL